MYTNHTTYNNLKNLGKRIGYLQYLDVLLASQSVTVHSELPKDCRLSRDYELCVEQPVHSSKLALSTSFRYIKSLHAYLLSFTKRAQPLVDIETQQRDAEEVFNRQWEAGQVEGWEETRQNKPAAEGEGEGIWCAACE